MEPPQKIRLQAIQTSYKVFFIILPLTDIYKSSNNFVEQKKFLILWDILGVWHGNKVVPGTG